MKYVLLEVKDRIGYVVLNRPDKRNALNAEFVTELIQSFQQMAADPDVKVVVLKARGDAFCAGADLAYLQQLQANSYEENLHDSQHLSKLFSSIHELPKVVIAQIEGHAIAGGCGLATVADFSFSVDKAKFGYSEVKIGFVPALVMVYLIRKIGEGKAKDLLLSGSIISADQAAEFGLINRVIKGADLSGVVQKFALELCENNSSESMRLVKEMIPRVQNLDLSSALDYAAEMNAQARDTEDCKKGIKAFLNKEKLEW